MEVKKRQMPKDWHSSKPEWDFWEELQETAKRFDAVVSDLVSGKWNVEAKIGLLVVQVNGLQAKFGEAKAERRKRMQLRRGRNVRESNDVLDFPELLKRVRASKKSMRGLRMMQINGMPAIMGPKKSVDTFVKEMEAVGLHPKVYTDSKTKRPAVVVKSSSW